MSRTNRRSELNQASTSNLIKRKDRYTYLTWYPVNCIETFRISSENVGTRGTQSQRDLLAHVSRSKSRYLREESQGRRRALQTRREGLYARETMEERQQGFALLFGPAGLQRLLQPGHTGDMEIS